VLEQVNRIPNSRIAVAKEVDIMSLMSSMTEQRIVDNRTFLLGLDELYRAAMRTHERGELLQCARRVAAALDLAPATGPVEGYYAEAPALTEYFQLMRALQAVSGARAPAVEQLPEFKRLRQVTSAPLYGKPESSGSLLPAGKDALWQALEETKPNWNAKRLLAAAHDAAIRTDDFSLVALAARLKDAVVLTATRESVVLYAAVLAGAMRRDEPQYVWQVDAALAAQARRFIDTFNALFNDDLPSPEAASAAAYWAACQRNQIEGRCVRLGFNDARTPTQHYHWAIRNNLTVHEFWHPEVWTTERYRSSSPETGRGFWRRWVLGSE
jgi:hypothetical protein